MCTNVSLFNPSDTSRKVTATAFFDSDSYKSYITQELAATLNLPVLATEYINVTTFGTNEALPLRCQNHTIDVIIEKGPQHLEVKSVPTLTGHLQHILVTQGAPHEIFTHSTCKPSILIGNDYFWDLALSKDFHYRLLPDGYRLLHIAVSDIIIEESLNMKNSVVCISIMMNDNLTNPIHHDDLAELVAKFWKLETVGIIDDPSKRDDEECLNFFNSTIFYNLEEKRYVVKLPFKIDPSQLPNNFSLAFSRLCIQLKSTTEPTIYGKISRCYYGSARKTHL